MGVKQIQWSITISALIIAAVHTIFPKLIIDAITLTLFIIALAPWLAPLIKSFELPGGVKVEFQNLQNIKEKADRAGLIKSETRRKATYDYSFQTVGEEDPNLALAGLRIEIEKRLRELAEAHNLKSQGRGIKDLLSILATRNVLTHEERSVIFDMIGLLNPAVHGATVDIRAAKWVMDIGPKILRGFDERIKQAKK